MRRGAPLLLLFAAAGAAAPALAQSNLTLSERVERLERQVQGGGGNSTADLVIQINQLEDEVRQLRGMVEEQAHEIESLKARQRDQYLDLDRRLQAISGGKQSAPRAGAPASSPQGGGESGGQPRQSSAGAGGSGNAPAGRPPQSTAGNGPGGESAAPVEDEASRKQAYEAAFSKLRDGQYADAATGFREFLDRYPGGPLADNAQYWLGESYYVTGNYDIALNAFQSVLSQFPNSAKAPDALLKLGFCYYELKQWEQARDTLGQVKAKYPDSAVARLAESRLRLMRTEGH